MAGPVGIVRARPSAGHGPSFTVVTFPSLSHTHPATETRPLRDNQKAMTIVFNRRGRPARGLTSKTRPYQNTIRRRLLSSTPGRRVFDFHYDGTGARAHARALKPSRRIYRDVIT